MLKRPQATVSLALECALLFLAIAVFSFGLQAKLSLYKSHPPSAAVAKLSTEKRSAHTIVARVVREKDSPSSPAQKIRLHASISLQRALVPCSALHQVELSLYDPGRAHLHGLHSLRRPPPSLFS